MSYGSVAVTPGSGANVAVDDVGGSKFQRFKPAFGAENSATDVSSTNPLPVTLSAVNVSHFRTADSDNTGNAKTSAGTLKCIRIFNKAAYAVYVHIYNKASAPTLGIDTIVLTVGCQAGVFVDYPIPDGGLVFSLGIARSVTKSIDGTTNNTVADDAVVQIFYV